MKIYVLIIFSFVVSFAYKQNTKGTSNNLAKDSISKVQVIKDGLGSKIDSLLRKELAMGFSGSVMVSIKENVVLRSGYGWTDSLRTVQVSPQTKFYLASTTKGITGVMALIAQENGILSVFDSLTKFNLNCPKDFSNISINEMLIHTSGLSSEYSTFGATGRKENMALLYKFPLRERGEFHYSGAGYWLTAAIIEQETKVPYEEYAHKKLFEIAEMNNTNFWFEIDEDDRNSFAQKLSKFPPDERQPNWGFRASSGVLTNIVDLENYLQALISYKLLNRKSLDQLFGPHKTLKSGIGIGYGWFTTTTSRGTTEIWSRGGEGFGHNSAIRWFKDEDVIILILANCGQIEGKDYEANKTVSDKIEKLIFEALRNKE